MPERLPLALGGPPRWRWMLAVLVVHVLLGSWLMASWQRPAMEQQRRSTMRMITVNLPPLPSMADRSKEHRAGRNEASRINTAQAPASVSSVMPDLPVRASTQPRPDKPMATNNASAPAMVEAVPLPFTGASAAMPSMAPLAAASAAPAPLAKASAASGPSGYDLMYGNATRLAIQQSTRGAPLLSERADQASQAPDRLDTSARLGREIKDAGAGDCIKGEYAGAGMGLLSTPFLLLAAARGKCAK